MQQFAINSDRQWLSHVIVFYDQCAIVSKIVSKAGKVEFLTFLDVEHYSTILSEQHAILVKDLNFAQPVTPIKKYRGTL